MLADEVAAVHEMARRQCVFRGKLDVATVAIARPPLIFVLVATEADRHLGPQHVGLFYADFDVAADTVAVRRRHVRAVLELEVYTRELCAAAHVGFAVAAVASALVVRLLVASHAIGRLREMERALVSGFGDALVARETSHALEDVGAMFERVGRFPAQCRARPRTPREAAPRRARWASARSWEGNGHAQKAVHFEPVPRR